jgi:hypothetical protein
MQTLLHVIALRQGLHFGHGPLGARAEKALAYTYGTQELWMTMKPSRMSHLLRETP